PGLPPRRRRQAGRPRTRVGAGGWGSSFQLLFLRLATRGLAPRQQPHRAQHLGDADARGNEIPQQHRAEHGVGGDHVVHIAHGAAPVARRRTQSLPASRARLSARARASSEPIAHSLVPTIIHSSGGIMLASIDDSPNTRMVWPWCSEFHHTTDKRMIASTTTPTIASSEAARAAARRSSIAAYRPITPTYRNSSTICEVRRGSQSHQVPHIGLPQVVPVARVTKVNPAPIGAQAMARISHSLIRHTSAIAP